MACRRGLGQAPLGGAQLPPFSFTAPRAQLPASAGAALHRAGSVWSVQPLAKASGCRAASDAHCVPALEAARVYLLGNLLPKGVHSWEQVEDLDDVEEKVLMFGFGACKGQPKNSPTPWALQFSVATVNQIYITVQCSGIKNTTAVQTEILFLTGIS